MYCMWEIDFDFYKYFLKKPWWFSILVIRALYWICRGGGMPSPALIFPLCKLSERINAPIPLIATKKRRRIRMVVGYVWRGVTGVLLAPLPPKQLRVKKEHTPSFATCWKLKEKRIQKMNKKEVLFYGWREEGGGGKVIFLLFLNHWPWMQKKSHALPILLFWTCLSRWLTWIRGKKGRKVKRIQKLEAAAAKMELKPRVLNFHFFILFFSFGKALFVMKRVFSFSSKPRPCILWIRRISASRKREKGKGKRKCCLQWPPNSAKERIFWRRDIEIL